MSASAFSPSHFRSEVGSINYERPDQERPSSFDEPDDVEEEEDTRILSQFVSTDCIYAHPDR